MDVWGLILSGIGAVLIATGQEIVAAVSARWLRAHEAILGSLGGSKPITVHASGNFMGELAQLAGRPALVDAVAQEPVEALSIPPQRLRALMIAEAELGERIMRALILRRVALLQAGIGGPIILGRTQNGPTISSSWIAILGFTNICTRIPA